MSKRKPIRINLQFYKGKEPVPIRDLDDLAENMNINDLVDSFLSGDLESWLRRTLNETERADKVSALEYDDKEDTLLKLFDALDLGFPESEVKETVALYMHQKARDQVRHLISGSKEDSPRHDSPARDDSQLHVYHEKRFEEYKQLKERIRNVPLNSPFSSHKVLIDELLNDYSDYFELEWFSFFYEMLTSNSEQNPGGMMAIFLLLLSPQWHPYYLALIDNYGENQNVRMMKQLLEWKKGGEDPYSLVPYYGTKPLQSKDLNEVFKLDDSGIEFYFEISWRIGWSDARIRMTQYVDNPNEMNDDPEKPIKIFSARASNQPEAQWKTLIPRGKKIFVLYRGEEMSISPDSTIPPDKGIYDGLRFNYRRNGRNRKYAEGCQPIQWDRIVFMEVK